MLSYISLEYTRLLQTEPFEHFELQEILHKHPVDLDFQPREDDVLWLNIGNITCQVVVDHSEVVFTAPWTVSAGYPEGVCRFVHAASIHVTDYRGGDRTKKRRTNFPY